MNTVIAKSIDTLISQSKKLPNFLLMILIFVELFTKQAQSVYSIIKEIIINILPISFVETLHHLKLSEIHFLEIWSALLVLMLIIFIWNIFEHFIVTPYRLELDIGGEILIYLNSLFLPSVFIYNKILDTPYKLTINFLKQNSNSLYAYFILIGFLVFLLIYSITYLRPVIGVFETILKFNIRTRYKLILVSLYLVILSKLLAELGKTIIGL
ncbi:hypothetical protein GIX45_16070 [Erwinia sp. CPCC 100877]|nr:hypothetical protein [Erwinia sp. CPCC 100877]